MLRRFQLPAVARNTTCLSAGVSATAMTCNANRTFFGKGWDNAAIDVAYRALLRKPEVNDRLVDWACSSIDGRGIESLVRRGKKAEEANSQVRLFLAPHLGDPHRLLKAYSLTAYPILDEQGEQLRVSVDGFEGEAFADPDDDFAKICFPNLNEIKFLAQELLALLEWEQSPRGAASLLESLYRGSEIPDHVFQTPAVIERRN